MISIRLKDSRYRPIRSFSGPRMQPVAILSQFKYNQSTFRVDLVRWNPEILLRTLAEHGFRVRVLDSNCLEPFHYQIEVQVLPDRLERLIGAIQSWSQRFARSPRLKVTSVTYVPHDQPTFRTNFKHVYSGNTLHARDYGYRAFAMQLR